MTGLGTTEAEIISSLDDYEGLVSANLDPSPTVADWIRSLNPLFAKTRGAFDLWGYFSIRAYLADLVDLGFNSEGRAYYTERGSRYPRSIEVTPPPVDITGPGVVAWFERWWQTFPKTSEEFVHQYQVGGVAYVSMYVFTNEFLTLPRATRLAVVDDPPPIQLPGWVPTEIITRPGDLSILYADKTRLEIEAAKEELKAASTEVIETLETYILPEVESVREGGGETATSFFSTAAITKAVGGATGLVLLGGALLAGFLIFGGRKR